MIRKVSFRYAYDPAVLVADQGNYAAHMRRMASCSLGEHLIDGKLVTTVDRPLSLGRREREWSLHALTPKGEDTLGRRGILEEQRRYGRNQAIQILLSEIEGAMMDAADIHGVSNAAALRRAAQRIARMNKELDDARESRDRTLPLHEPEGDGAGEREG